MPKLTKRLIDSLLAKGEPAMAWDSDLRGFGFRVRNGRGTYSLKYRHLGKQRWLTLGEHGEITPTQARDRATDARAKIRQGIDPAEELRRKDEAAPAAAPITFRQAAARYLKEATKHLAATTREDRQGLLREKDERHEAGPILKYFGGFALAEIGRKQLLDWYTSELQAMSPKTARNRIDAVSCVFAHAIDLEIIDANQVDALRAVLRRRNRTKEARSRLDPSRNIRPIERSEEIQRLLAASAARPWIDDEDGRAGGADDGHILTLLLLDAGLRLGEALGLRWGDVRLGRDASDPARALVISQTRARGRHEGVTKSGRARTVALSRRLRAVLQARFLAAGRPSSTERVLPNADSSNYRKRHFARACVAAKIGARSPKDLRDTYASWLLSVGVQLGYVSQQLGHADVAVTARHYAKWVGGGEYRQPITIDPGEVPADLLSRLPGAAAASDSDAIESAVS